MVLNLMDLN